MRAPFFIALPCVLALCGCTEGDPGAAHEDGGRDAAPHDGGPATAPDDGDPGSSGAFVACEPILVPRFGTNVSFDCERCGPNGSCPLPDLTQGECDCYPGYDGTRCERCADGYVDQEGACLTQCEAAGSPCNGECSGTIEAPSCACAIGYDEPDCDRCSPGFKTEPRVFDAVACIPTCDGSCTPEEVCTAPSPEEQSCECMEGYDREGDACVWGGLIRDPSFEQGCAHWQLLRKVANTTDTVVAEITPSGLTLSVDHVCSAAVATARAFLPTQLTMPGAAIAITASGSVEAKLRVSFEAPEGPSLISPIGEQLVGTGSSERYLVCLPLDDRGRAASLTLVVGENGTCAESLDSEFTVQTIELVTDDACEP